MSVILVNDYLHGINDERTLWDFMLEGIPNIVRVDIPVLDSNPILKKMNIPFEKKVEYYINHFYPDHKLIIQNGTFFPLILSSKPKVAFIQDNLRKMQRPTHLQEYNFKNADYIVTNSNEVDKYYHERSTHQIPLGIDTKLFSILDKKELRNKYQIDTEKYKHIGIFVGALNEVKGWSRVKNIIHEHKDVFWIIVTKYSEDVELENGRVFSRINQETLSELYNCADFFILGSPSETQCLAAIECCLCDVPIIMLNTGFLTNLSSEEKDKVGIIGDDLEGAVYKLKNTYTNYKPREVLYDYYSIDDMCKKWIELIEKIC